MNTNLQTNIDKILYSDYSKAEKFSQLKNLFSDKEIIFSDFDDTITPKNTMFFAKIHSLRRFLRQKNEKIFPAVLPKIEINSEFLKLRKEKDFSSPIVIISRNDHEFIKYFIQKSKDIFDKLGIEIIGGIGNQIRYPNGTFFMKSEEKRNIIPDKKFFISDKYERKNYKNYEHFLSVDKGNKDISGTKEFFSKGRKFFLFIIKSAFKKTR
ncbi:MAG TPA: hypothetical protein PKD96_00115 [Candidatus Absconditabacterales bacterium]|nr:hypothetical protein [Candidatus Absconditabacterales bacterium]HMT26686.1 hypothetical protein [Candidatus Absconditabacterales bacterium]